MNSNETEKDILAAVEQARHILQELADRHPGLDVPPPGGTADPAARLYAAMDAAQAAAGRLDDASDLITGATSPLDNPAPFDKAVPAPSAAYILLLDVPADPADILTVLTKAGSHATALIPATRPERGISVTIAVAEEEWNSTTDAAQCDEACPAEARRHVLYQDLTPEQKDAYHADLAQALDYHRAEHYMPERSNLPASFDSVLLEACDDPPPSEDNDSERKS